MKFLDRSPNIIVVCYLTIAAVVLLSLPSSDSNSLIVADNSDKPSQINYSELPEEHREAMQTYVSTIEKRGIPGDILIAIAKHETGNFAAVIGKANFFGLKCIDKDQDQCTNTRTREISNGASISKDLAFQSCKNINFCAQVIANTLIELAGLKSASKQEVQEFFADRKRALDVIGKNYATDSVEPNDPDTWADKVNKYL